MLSPYFFAQNLRKTYGLEVPPSIFGLFMRFLDFDKCRRWDYLCLILLTYVDFCTVFRHFLLHRSTQLYTETYEKPTRSTRYVVRESGQESDRFQQSSICFFHVLRDMQVHLLCNLGVAVT